MYVFSWQFNVFIATVAFVIGQIFLRLSELSLIDTTAIFMITMGIICSIGWIIIKIIGSDIHTLFETRHKWWPAIFAGCSFTIGNIIWISSIKRAPNIAIVRVLMAGLEIAALAMVSFILFKNTLSWYQIGLTLIGMTSLVTSAGI